MMKLNQILMSVALLFVILGTTSLVAADNDAEASLSAQLYDAIVNNRPDEVENIVQDPTAPEDFVNSYMRCHGYSYAYSAPPLLLACDKGHLAVVEVLLMNGAKVDCQDSDGLSALDVTIFNWRQDIVARLLGHSSAPSNFINKQSRRGGKPIGMAGTNVEMIRYLRSCGAEKEPFSPRQLRQAMYARYLDAVQLWFDDHSSVEDAMVFINQPMPDEEHRHKTWLAIACIGEANRINTHGLFKDRVVRFLLEHGAIIPTEGVLASDLLYSAIIGNVLPIIKRQLRKNSALVREPLPNGQMPIDFARGYGMFLWHSPPEAIAFSETIALLERVANGGVVSEAASGAGEAAISEE